MADLCEVDPGELCLPSSRRQGADPVKLQRQIAFFLVGRVPGCRRHGFMRRQMAYNGVTQATRIAKLSSGTPIKVEVIGKLPINCAAAPKVGDVLP